MKSMTNTANVENAGSINNPPGCLSITKIIYAADSIRSILPVFESVVGAG